MREYKFRTWLKEYYQDENDNFKSCVRWRMSEPYKLNQPNDDDGFGCADEINMQYTGLQDRNGKEIYEGDIVRFDNNIFTTSPIFNIEYRTSTGQIAWDDKGCSYGAIDSAGKNYVWCEELTESMEVIGNIHENPGLMAANERR